MSSRFHPSDEDRIVTEVTRELERLEADPGVPPSADFTDRVMAAVHHAPVPQPARAFSAAILAGRIGAAARAVADAWRVATRGFAPIAIRAQALALVLVVAGLGVALAGGAAVGAMNVLTSGPAPSQPIPNVAPSSVPSASALPSPSNPPAASDGATAEPTDSTSPSDTPQPTDTIEPTHSEDHSGGGSPDTLAPRTPEPTDDHGGSSGSGPGSGDSGSGSSGSGSGDSGSSGSGGGGPTETPSPTEGHTGSSDG